MGSGKFSTTTTIVAATSALLVVFDLAREVDDEHTGTIHFRTVYRVCTRRSRGDATPGRPNRSSLGFLVSHAHRRSSGLSRPREYNFKRALLPRAPSEFVAWRLGDLPTYIRSVAEQFAFSSHLE